jgi:hypothetical protein
LLYPGNEQAPVEMLFHVAEHQWAAFWQVVEDLQVWQGPPIHRVAHDGWRWRLDLADATRDIRITGRNSSPPGFREFAAAINTLVSGAWENSRCPPGTPPISLS